MFFEFISVPNPNQEQSGNARGSLSSIGSASPNQCIDNDGKSCGFLSFYSILLRFPVR